MVDVKWITEHEHIRRISSELVTACKHGNLEVVKQLVKEGAFIPATFSPWSYRYSDEIKNYLELARKMKALEI